MTDRPDEDPTVPPSDDDPGVAPDRDTRAAAERDAQTDTVVVGESVSQRLRAAVTGGEALVTVLAFLSALAVGALLIAFSDEAVRETLSYLFARPSDALAAAAGAVGDAYSALLRGAVAGRGPISETLVAATPLILTGLAVTIPLRAGLFNIGGEGQVIAGGLVGGFVGFAVTGLPLAVHLPLAILAGMVGGALWGAIPGVLKARTGAHEVIVTIMLNNVALLLLEQILSSEAFRPADRPDPISEPILDSARLPLLAGDDLRVHAGLLLALGAGAAVWWLLERSTVGFELNAVGLNPAAATTAGMRVGRTTVVAMTIAGALAGLGGTSQVLGVGGRITTGFSAGLGFDGITTALLGRGTVGGTVAAGLLFGALRAGGRTMQAETATSLDLVVVIQGLIIVFIAAPALVRALYRIRVTSRETGQVAQGWGS